MTQVKFRLAAYTDAAGRYNPEAPRNGNEDNMFVNADLGAPEGSPFFESDKETVLSEYGCLLVVADGMGGMNAGEVASEIAVKVVKDAFSKEAIPYYAIENPEGREKYLKKVVVEADVAIKKHSQAHPECEGMGSTLVIAWLYNGNASIAWLGDSRIYLFREPDGLRQLSKDHSYVQELVDAGKITDEEAFTHPYNNIITRSLGDTSKKAEADSTTVKLIKGDIILLNSDGLSGVLRDDELCQIIRSNRETMSSCRTALWEAAEAAEWHDNVTAVLCEITEGEETNQGQDEVTDTETDETDKNMKPIQEKTKGRWRRWIRIAGIAVGAIVVACLIGLALIHKSKSVIEEGDGAVKDSVSVIAPIDTSDSSIKDAGEDEGKSLLGHPKKKAPKENNSEEGQPSVLPTVNDSVAKTNIATESVKIVPAGLNTVKEPSDTTSAGIKND